MMVMVIQALHGIVISGTANSERGDSSMHGISISGTADSGHGSNLTRA